METIASLKNEFIETARALGSGKGRRLAGRLLLEGEQILLWAIQYNVAIDFIITSLPAVDHIISRVPYPVRVFTTTEGLMKKITGTSYLVPLIGVGRAVPDNRGNDFILVLDDVRDHGNIGTIVRTANAFGITGVVATGDDFDLYRRKTIEASRGTVFRTRCSTFSSPGEAIRYLRDNGFQIVTTSPRGSELQSLVRLASQPVALVVGNESGGASDEFMKHSDVVMRIPMMEQVESLNVGVAAGISVYELRLKQVIQMIEERIKTTLGRELNVASMLFREALDREMRRVSSLSSDQLVFLMVLRCDATMSRSGIQRQFGILDAEFGGFMGLLEGEGMVTEASPDRYSITEKGIEIIGKLWPVVEGTEQRILSDFTEDETKKLFEMLKRIERNSMRLP
ncbi:MAG: hypothetical protein JXA20_11830 [Spirochaetes bacterium]|nr:hypothetical protein [Spirochaetota bacterium]